jgi:hypothetical protein
VIRFGLRLTLRGGREAAARLVVITAAVALGVGLLLATVAGLNAVNLQNGRYAWLETSAGAAAAPGSVSAGDPLWWQLRADEFRGEVIGRVDLAATGPHSPVPPGIPRLPGPGEYYASPALAQLLARTPRAELADRYPGRQVGTIGDSALPGPDSLILVVGHAPAELASTGGATLVTSISTTSPSSCNDSCFAIGVDSEGIDLILSIVAAALLFPVLIFIGVATRLSAARREQRFAALRLVGATPIQVAVIATVESTVAALIGVAAGFGVFYAIRPVLATIRFTGERFFVPDLTLTPVDIAAVAIGVPLAAAVAARVALRRVIVTPLGVARRVTPRAPRAWRVVPLLLGLAELAFFVLIGRPHTTDGQIAAYLTGILVTMTGLIVAGPWLTMTGSRLLARRAGRPDTLIAARRLADDPHAGFRAISGLVLALFVTSVAVGVITTVTVYDGDLRISADSRSTLLADFTDYRGPTPSTSVGSVPSSLTAHLTSITGVTAVAVIHAQPPAENFPFLPGIVACADLARMPAFGRCVPGATTANIEGGALGTKFARDVWPPATLSVAQLSNLPILAIGVATDGSWPAIEQARTVLETANLGAGGRSAPLTLAENRAQDTQRAAGYRLLAEVVVLATLPIAGCTLAVSVVTGLNDRRRPFSLLRLTGVPLRVLRRVVIMESALPLLLGAAVSLTAGFVAAYLFLRSQLSEALQPPDVSYYAAVTAGLIGSLAVIASTLPLLGRLTGPDSARNE